MRFMPTLSFTYGYFQMIAGTNIGLGAQNMHWEDSGVSTGEVSPLMVKEFCNYIIIGHSERRRNFAENDESG